LGIDPPVVPCRKALRRMPDWTKSQPNDQPSDALARRPLAGAWLKA